MILCSDFDNTLHSSKSECVLAQNLFAIHYWRSAGHTFVIATKHDYAAFGVLLPDWQSFVDYIITNDGGTIFSNKDQLVHACCLPYRLVQNIRSLVCNQALSIVYSPERHSIELLLSEPIIKLRLHFKTETLFYRWQERLEAKNWPIKILPQPRPEFDKLPGSTNLSQFFGYLDIIPQDSNRKYALEHLVNTEFSSCPRADILTVGNGDDDIAMLQRFQGYAIADSPKKVVTAVNERIIKSVADLIYQHL